MEAERRPTALHFHIFFSSHKRRYFTRVINARQESNDSHTLK